MTTTNGFDMWCIVELMGHNRIAGKVTEQVIAGTAMLRVDVPKTPQRDAFTKFYNATALYAITPTDEATAMKAAIAFEVAPISEYILRLESPALTAKVVVADDDDDSDYGYSAGGTRSTGWFNVATPDEDEYGDVPENEGHEDDDETAPYIDSEYIDAATFGQPNEVIPSRSQIVRMERDETKNSKSPMWRCVDVDGDRVNVFKHSDPAKDTFRLFNEAGYGPMMELMKVGESITWKQHPINVHMEKKGDWWEVVHVEKMPVGAKPEVQITDSPKLAAAKWAKELLASGDFVILDTETTGLNKGDKDDEPVQIAVIDSKGIVLVNTLVKPSVSIDAGAAAVHGITEEMVKDAPTFAEIREKLIAALKDKTVVVYNADYDYDICMNANGTADWEFPRPWHCAMNQYAAFYGEWRKGSFAWQSLSNACEQQGIVEVRHPFTAVIEPAHSALGDCLRTLALIQKMAAYEETENNVHPF